MNEEQTKSAVRSFVAIFGGTAAGFIAGKGWATSQQVLGVLTSDTFIQGVAAIASAASLVWGLFAHSQKNAVAVVDAIPEVAGVITKSTVAGKALAESVPSKTVATAGTPAAASVAQK